MEKTFHLLYEYLLNIGIPEHLAKFLNMITLFILFFFFIELTAYLLQMEIPDQYVPPEFALPFRQLTV